MNHTIHIGFETAVPDEQAVRELIEQCAVQTLTHEGVAFAAAVDVTVMGADEIRALNREFRDKDAVTDVLSFPMYAFLNGVPQEELERESDGEHVMLGDMALCYDRATQQAVEYGHSPARESGYLTVHSMLHLLGYDHERTEQDTALMRRREEDILSALGLTRN